MGEEEKIKISYCTNCGHELKPEDKFCSGCGSPNPNYQASGGSQKDSFAADEQKDSWHRVEEEKEYSQNQTSSSSIPDISTINSLNNKAEKKDKKSEKIYTGRKDSFLPLILAVVSFLFLGFVPGFSLVLTIIAFILATIGIKRNYPNTKSKIGIIFAGLGLLMSILAVLVGASDDSDTAGTDTSTPTEQTAEENQTTDAGGSDNALDFDMSAGMNLYNGGEYQYITTDDLFHNAANLNGQKIYTVITIDKKEEDGSLFQADIGDNYMFTDFAVVDGSFDKIPEGTKVAILGQVGDMTDLKFTNVINVKDCYVFAAGDDVAQYDLGTSADSLAQFLTSTDSTTDNSASTANSGEMSEEEYKALCQTYDYETILRNPDQYKNKYCVVSGKVSQTVDGLFGLYTTIYIKDANGNRWGCNYNYSEGESRVLEGDSITVYGMLDGTANTETVLGKQVTMPFVSIEYIN